MLTEDVFVAALPNYVRVSTLANALCLTVKQAREALKTIMILILRSRRLSILDFY